VEVGSVPRVRRRAAACAVAIAVILPVILGGGAPGAGASSREQGAAPASSAGCGEPDTGSGVAAGSQRVTTTSNGVARAYLRRVPSSYDGVTPLPLVVDLHGHSEPAALHEVNSALAPFGDGHRFVTITPEGSGPVPHWDTRAESADMHFVSDLLDEVEMQLCIDRRRVYVAGYSNGAFLASAMVCLFADRIAAVAAVAGVRDVPGCDPDRPVPVVAFHGDADEFVGFEGGLGPGVTDLPPAERQALIDVAAPTDSGSSIPEVAAAWAKRNGCRPKPSRRSVAPDVEVARYRCPHRADVHLYAVRGGGHTWPGSTFSKSIEQFVGPTTDSIDANTVMWRFFRAHPLRKR
jgi:polyhydroxybutyrate depolymerase